MDDAMIGYWQEEVASGRMDPKEAFDLLVGFHGDMMDLQGKQYDEAIELLRSAGRVIITHKIAAVKNEDQRKGLSDVIESLNRTIFQTWSYLASYTNDKDDATHAKRLLQNCLLVRGPEGMKAAVKKRMLAPPPVKWWKRPVWWQSWHYTFFGVSVCGFAFYLGRDPIQPGLAAWWLILAFIYAMYIAAAANPKGNAEGVPA